MKISPIFDVNMFFSGWLEKYVYKITKGVVNVFYPLITTITNSGVDSKSRIIVSLTSIPSRINTLWITISSLLSQTLKPQKVLLWLAEDEFKNKEKDLPESLIRLQQFGLEIHFCKNLRSHKKYFFAMQAYPEFTIVTADDDVFYPEYLLEELSKTSNIYPNTICCTWAHRLIVRDNKTIAPYSEWESGISGNIPSYDIVPIGCGGVLYPSGVLSEEAFNERAIMELCPNADDLWLKMMANLKGTKAVRISKKPRMYFTILSTQKSGLRYQNVRQNKNDEAINKILNSYPAAAEVY